MAIIGYGTTLGYATTQGGSYTAITLVTDLNKPKVSVTDVNVSSLLSTSAAKEFIPGMIEGGEPSFKLLFDKTQEAALYALLRTTYWWKITLADSGSTWVWQGHIKEFGGDAVPMDDKVETSVTIKVTGKPVFTAGS